MQQAAEIPVQRQFERTPLRANAFVHRGARFQRAQIVDYSQGGLQLEGTFGLIRQDPIQIELMSGMRISGKVAWSLGAHTGIVFAEPLPSTHPAIVELTRRARKSLAEQSLPIAQGSRRYA
jgi:PilZ domain-containing protein